MVAKLKAKKRLFMSQIFALDSPNKLGLVWVFVEHSQMCCGFAINIVDSTAADIFGY